MIDLTMPIVLTLNAALTSQYSTFIMDPVLLSKLLPSVFLTGNSLTK